MWSGVEGMRERMNEIVEWGVNAKKKEEDSAE